VLDPDRQGAHAPARRVNTAFAIDTVGLDVEAVKEATYPAATVLLPFLNIFTGVNPDGGEGRDGSSLNLS
jgi:hypothetical protein